MRTSETFLILRSLADGIDPDSGEPVPPDSIVRRPLVIQALYEAIIVLELMQI